MTTKKSYSRHFIILQEEEKGYALASDKLPSGYAKIEIKNDKCRITYYVQNLKKEMCPYHMILICNKKDVKKIINLGELNIDDYGRTEVAYEYNSEDLHGSGIGIEKVIGASIAKISEASVSPVMVGFITSENQGDWKSYPVFSKVEKEDDVEVEQVMMPEKATLVEEIKDQVIPEAEQETISEIVPIQQEVPIEDAVVQTITERNEPKNKFDSYESQIQSEIEGLKKETENTQEDRQEEIKEEIKEERQEDYQEDALGDYFRRVVDGYEELNQAFTNIKRCKWYKIPVIQESDYHNVSDYDKYSIIYYPMYGYFNYIKKYQHFLMGYKWDSQGRIKYIVYAIPGKRTSIEQPFRGDTGFVSWYPASEREDSQGYWLMFYDFQDRTIVVPINKA